MTHVNEVALMASRDDLLSTLRTYLSIKIMIKDIDGFKDFIKYINRYTASEVQFLIEEKGYKADIETARARVQIQKANQDE